MPVKGDEYILSNGPKFREQLLQWLSHNLGILPANPVQSDAVRISDVSQVQIHLFHWVVAVIVKCGHVGAFDSAKLRSPTQNCPVHNTYSTSGDKGYLNLEILFLLYSLQRTNDNIKRFMVSLTESLSLWVPQVVQSLDVLSVVHII